MSEAPAPGGQGAAVISATPIADTPIPQVNDPNKDWTASFGDELDRGYVQNKGWKAPTDLLRSYRELEKFKGAPADRLLKLPEKEDDPEWNAVWGRLGKPEKADDYKIEVGDPEYAAHLRNVMFENNLTKAQAEKFIARDNEFRAARAEKEQKAWEQQSEKDVLALKDEWGAGFDAQTEAGRRFAKTVGMTKEQLGALEGALGTKGLLEFMAKAGSMLTEADVPAGGSSQSMGMTPAMAKAKIEELKGDPEWVGRYMEGGVKEQNEMQRLVRFANGMAAS